MSPGYLLATPELKPTTGVYSPSQDITVTAVAGPKGSFYVTRKTAYRDAGIVNYTLTLPTSRGRLTIPHLGGTLTMPGRDSRIHVTDYPIGPMKLIYSTAEVFTWQKFEDGQTVVVLYGAIDETHELLLLCDAAAALLPIVSSGAVKSALDGSYLYAQWKTTGTRQWIGVGNTWFYMIGK